MDTQGPVWTPPEDGLERMRRLGLYPRIPRFGEIRVVGLYDLPFVDELLLLEVIVRRPWWMVNLEDWHPYEPPGWDEQWQIGRPRFYFSEDGTELVGSYLDAPPITSVTRMGLLLDGMDGRVPQPQGKLLKVPDSGPVPERLLRLIWVE